MVSFHCSCLSCFLRLFNLWITLIMTSILADHAIIERLTAKITKLRSCFGSISSPITLQPLSHIGIALRIHRPSIIITTISISVKLVLWHVYWIIRFSHDFNILILVRWLITILIFISVFFLSSRKHLRICWHNHVWPFLYSSLTTHLSINSLNCLCWLKSNGFQPLLLLVVIKHLLSISLLYHFLLFTLFLFLRSLISFFPGTTRLHDTRLNSRLIILLTPICSLHIILQTIMIIIIKQSSFRIVDQLSLEWYLRFFLVKHLDHLLLVLVTLWWYYMLLLSLFDCSFFFSIFGVRIYLSYYFNLTLGFFF